MKGTVLSKLSENEQIRQAYREAAESVLELIISCCSPAEDEGDCPNNVQFEHYLSCDQEPQLHKHSVVNF